MNADEIVAKVVGMKGGHNGTYYEILAEVERGMSKYWPAVIDGVEVSYFDFKSLEEYAKHKVERERMTIRFMIAGNPVAAEEDVSRVTGCKCLSISPTTLDVYIEQPIASSAAAELGHRTSSAKARSSRDNGRLGGRPRKAQP